jgi:hypothetical protein
MRSAWFALTLLCLAGCVSTTTPSSSATPVPPSRIFARDYTKPGEGLAMLVVTRDAGMWSKTCDTDLFVDGVKVANIQPAEQVRLFVEEGEHLVGVIARGTVCLAKSSQTTVNATRAKPYLLRIRSANGLGITIEQSAF